MPIKTNRKLTSRLKLISPRGLFLSTCNTDWQTEVRKTTCSVLYLTGAWEAVDESVPTAETESIGSREFDDDYDPKTEADIVGKAFGDYKKKRKKQETDGSAVPQEFEDWYKPEVDHTDPLASAFGDGFRMRKPDQVSL